MPHLAPNPVNESDPEAALPQKKSGLRLQAKRHLLTIAVVGILLLVIQTLGSAWTAEFDGFPDESAQFVSGQLLRQFVITMHVHDPMGWAGQYYLHYPKVGIGHWPPAYHVMEALWSIVFGPSRIAAMLLQWFLAAVGLVAFVNLARRRLSWIITCGIVLLTVATPVFQTGLEQTMAEPACFLCGVAFLYAMVAFLEHPRQLYLLLTLLSIGVAVLTKGTGALLAMVPVMAWIVSGKRFPLPSKKVLAVLAIAAVICAVSYASAGNIMDWGGMRFAAPWPIWCLGALAGWGFVALAIVGVRREPLPLVAACMCVSAVVFSFFVRAMSEPRHWIIILPAIMLLAGEAVASRPRWAAPVLAAALFLFPWYFYRQQPAGYRELFRQLPLPARILISANSANGEGGAVAEVVILDRKPLQSFVARASKVFASSGWNGENYQLLVNTVAEIDRRLDELAIDEVILDTPDASVPVHLVATKQAMEGNPDWRLCAQAGRLKAYCRVAKPRFPRVPLDLVVAGHRLTEQIDAESAPASGR